MKKNLKSVFLIVLVLAIVATTAISGAVAYMLRQTEQVANNLIPAEVICDIHEEFDGTNKTSITVENKSNIPVYIRLKVISYWQDSKGNKVMRASTPVSIVSAANWIAKDGMYYYTDPVAVGASTGEFLGQDITLSKVDEVFQGVTYTYHQVVEVIAEAIQASPTSTVASVWGVALG